MDFDECADGRTYDHDRDHVRLSAQRRRVWDAMSDGQWHTLNWLATVTGDPEASISARLRDLRKPKFGGHEVQRAYLHDGLWSYRLIPVEQTASVLSRPEQSDGR